jgi:hypothetical protein
MATQPHLRYALAEYADLDSAAEVRCEYLDAAIYSVASGSPDQAQIESSLTRHLGNAPSRCFDRDPHVLVSLVGCDCGGVPGYL